MNRGSVDIKVLHAERDSPLFARDRLLSMGKNPEQVIQSLNHAHDALRYLQNIQGSTLRRRSHSLPFLWRLYIVQDRLYFMPYFSDKDAVRKSPVLVYKKGENSLFNTFREWFDKAWTDASPEHVSINDLVSHASPAGAALFLKWRDKHVFGVPARDFVAQRSPLRFYGIGGKREGNETFEDCAAREANEELRGAVRALRNADKTTYVFKDGTARPISITGMGTRPRLILEKADHSGLGFMPIDADNYTLVAFDAELRSAPTPHQEVVVIVLVPDACLKMFRDQPALSVETMKRLGAEFITQEGREIGDNAILSPHGTASFLVRTLP